MNITAVTRVSLLVILLTGALAPLQAQETGSLDLNRAAQYFLGSGDEILIKVNVLGYIQRPGQYLVPRHTDLISLISFAGGFRPGAKMTQVRILRKAGMEKNNGGTGENAEEEILSINVKRYFESGQSREIPTLEAGDTVLVLQSAGSKFRGVIGITSVVSVIAVVATVLIAYDRLQR